MDDSFLYQRNTPIQSKSLQYIFTEPTQFTAPQVGAENVADRDFIVEDKPKEIPKQTSILGFDIDDLRSGLLQREMLKAMYPDLQKAQDVTELPSSTSAVSSKTAPVPTPTLKSDDSLDPNNPFLYKNIDMGFTFDHEQGRRDKMHDAYMNGSYALRGPGILDTTWQDYANATGDARYKDWANMDNAQRTDLVRKFMGWYLDPVISKYDLSKLSQRQRNMIADVAWEYGQNSGMVRDAYAAFTSGDPNAFVNLKNNVGYYYNKPRNKQFKNWGLKRWDARLKYLYG